LLADEYDNSDIPNPILIWQILTSFSLILVGIFHTNASGRIIAFKCGPTKINRPWTMTVSTLIHSTAALLFMISLPATNLKYLGHPQNTFEIVMAILTVFTLFILFVFLVIQGIINLPMLISSRLSCLANRFFIVQTTETGPRSETCNLCFDADHKPEYRCTECIYHFCQDMKFTHDKFCYTDHVRPLVGVITPLWPNGTFQLSSQTSRKLYISSFILESCLVFLVVTVTALLSLHYNRQLQWF
jgi:hypothetical protein